MWWSGLQWAQPPKPRKRVGKVNSDPMGVAPKRSMCADLLGGPKGPVPSGLGIIEDPFMIASTDKQLEETKYRLRKLSKGFKSDYMGTFKKPRDVEHLNDLLFNHNHTLRKKAPV